MAQQLNLYDPRFAPVRQRWSARQGLLAVGAVLALGWGGQFALDQAAQAERGKARGIAQATLPLKAQAEALKAATDPAGDAELRRLQQVVQGQARVRQALDSGAAGVREGHADTLMALARQATGQVWLTGLSVAEGSGAIDLEGRMTDPRHLADYLRRLNAEPRFRGRPFAQLQLSASDANGEPLPYTEFVLRSQPRLP